MSSRLHESGSHTCSSHLTLHEELWLGALGTLCSLCKQLHSPVLSAGMIMFASAICVRAGAASQAAFEIIRQVWIISIQLFESLNVATQAMAAGFLGQDDRNSAREVLERSFNLSCGIGLAIGLLLFVGQGHVVHLFTKDAVVATLAGAIMPVIAFFMPLDAGASIMDGGLIAAGQTNTLSVIQVLGSLVQYAVLAYLVSNKLETVVTVWGVLKILTVARLGGGYWLHFMSGRSAYRDHGSSGSKQQPDTDQADGVVVGQVSASATDCCGSITNSASTDSSLSTDSSVQGSLQPAASGHVADMTISSDSMASSTSRPWESNGVPNSRHHRLGANGDSNNGNDNSNSNDVVYAEHDFSSSRLGQQST